jgi:hypothetical protein
MPAAVARPVVPDLVWDPDARAAPDFPVLALRLAGFAAAHVSAEPEARVAPDPCGGFLDLVAACLPPREAR